MAQSTVETPIERVVESQSWLDGIARSVQPLVSRALRPGPVGTPLRNLLHGTWLGHPLHPALTDLPIGAFTLATVFDLLSYQPRSRVGQAADWTMLAGFVGALTAATSGLADWSYTHGKTRQIGMAHALCNVTATSLYGASLAFRAGGNREIGRRLGFLAYGVVSLGAYLGGQLSYRCGVGVNHAAFQEGPEGFVDVPREATPTEGEMRGFVVGSLPVLLARRQGQVYALAGTCPHLGCSLADGRLEDDTLTCPCHLSQFRLTTGEAIRGPTAYSLAHLEVREVAGRLQVRQAEPVC